MEYHVMKKLGPELSTGFLYFLEPCVTYRIMNLR